MSLVVAAPEIMISAATDLASLGSTLRAATAAAATPTGTGGAGNVSAGQFV